MSSIEPKYTLFIDIRSTQIPAHWASGVSLFTQELTKAYLKEVQKKPDHMLYTVLLGNGSIPEWVQSCLKEFPGLLTYASFQYREPTYFRHKWSQKVWKKYTSKQPPPQVWLFPWNFDSPNITSHSNQRVVQVVHDLITRRKDLGFHIIKRAFTRFFIKQHKHYRKIIATISHSTARELGVSSFLWLPPGVSLEIGHSTRPTSIEKTQMRLKLLQEWGLLRDQNQEQTFITRPWFLTVGRNTQYKNLQLAEKIVQTWPDTEKRPILIWIGEDQQYSGQFTPNPDWTWACHHIRKVEDLNKFYQVSDLLIHPSQAEGFGLPIAEAFCAGLPTLAHQTIPALEEIALSYPKTPHSLLLYSIPSFEVEAWQNQAKQVLNSLEDRESDLYRFQEACQKIPPRSYLTQVGGITSEETILSWERAAQNLLNFIDNPPNH